MHEPDRDNPPRESAEPEANRPSPSKSGPTGAKQLGDELREVTDQPVHVPAETDTAVLGEARRRLRPIRRRRQWRHAAGAGLAAAAALGLAAGAYFAMPGGPPGSEQSAPPASPGPIAARGPVEDIDGNGKVDVLDALRLAKRLERGQTPEAARFDVTGDQRVNESDVQAITERAVALDQERES